MKKTIISGTILLVTGILTSSVSFAQTHGGGNGPENPVQVGSVVFNIGLGVGGNYRGDSYGTAFGAKAAVEFGLWQAGPGVITLGPEIGGSFSNGGYNYTGNNGNYRSNIFIIAGRAAWHYGWEVKGLDTYGGFSAGVGFHHWGYKDDPNYDYNETIPVFGGFLGASYFITPTFGFNAEVGYDITNFQVGVVLKLK